MILRKISILLLIGWAIFIPSYFYNYFYGENSLSTLKTLKENRRKLLKEKKFWQNRVEVLKERIDAIDKNKEFFYKKLSREMLIKGEGNEETYLFVNNKKREVQILNKKSTKTEE